MDFFFKTGWYIECISIYMYTLFHQLLDIPDSRLMGPTWGPSGADRTQVGPMLAPWTLLSGMLLCIEYPLSISESNVKKITFCYKCINYRLVKHKSCTLLPPDKSQSSFYIPCAIWVFYSINITVIMFTSQLLFPLSSLYFGEKLGSR